MIVTVKVGDKYGPEYVNRLARAVLTHTMSGVGFLCLTDDPKGITCATAPIETSDPGWWAKLVLFKPHPALAGSRVVFMDLDTVIVGNIDFLFDYDGPFAILRDFYVPTGFGSAIMSIAPGFGRSAIWDAFRYRAQHYIKTMHGDQDLIRCVVPRADLWQDMFPDKIVSYKVHCTKIVPAGARIVCFHGEPKPHDLPEGHSLRQVWEDGRVPVTN